MVYPQYVPTNLDSSGTFLTSYHNVAGKIAKSSGAPVSAFDLSLHKVGKTETALVGRKLKFRRDFVRGITTSIDHPQKKIRLKAGGFQYHPARVDKCVIE
jgi:hypothetical protein